MSCNVIHDHRLQVHVRDLVGTVEEGALILRDHIPQHYLGNEPIMVHVCSLF